MYARPSTSHCATARTNSSQQFDTCTRPLGALRQLLFSCLTCNPPPASASDPYTPAGVCYSCSISCHGEHTLVELFNKRNFVCDCGTTRLPATSPCTLRVSEETGLKGNAHSEKPAEGNKYNQNFRNRFCGCGEEYDAHQERGTMFQCLGLGSVEDGGCGEDWWHPECVIGLSRNWYMKAQEARLPQSPKHTVHTAVNGHAGANGATGPLEGESTPMPNTSEAEPTQVAETAEEDETPLPPGFPEEDDFEHLICYKCTNAFPWIKRYAATDGFLPPVFYKPTTDGRSETEPEAKPFEQEKSVDVQPPPDPTGTELPSRKRKADEDPTGSAPATALAKRQKSLDDQAASLDAPNSASNTPRPTVPATTAEVSPLHSTLPPPLSAPLSLFLKQDFRTHLCHCATCFPLLTPHPQLLEEEESYEPALSSDGDANNPAGSIGTASLLDRGEAALSNVDRVRAIEGVMVYNHLRDKVKAFLQPFAESGQAVGAEDIKSYFEGLRGDAEGIRAAAGAAGGSGDGGGSAGADRREQRGY